jgi:DNA-binding NtrC family response regulator
LHDRVIQHHGSLREQLAELERQIIMDTLHSVGGNKIKAAKTLGIHRSSLYEKIRHHNVL